MCVMKKQARIEMHSNDSFLFLHGRYVLCCNKVKQKDALQVLNGQIVK